VLGTVLALTNSSGNVTAQYGYDPFGNTTSSGSTSTNVFQYTGRENDGNGLYSYRARYYNPTFGRFISEDPISFAGGINVYAYTKDSPANWIDPFGLDIVVVQYAGADGNPGGHVGIGVNTDQTVGFYPNSDWAAAAQVVFGPPTPGHIQPDDPNGNRTVENTIIIPTSPDEDAAAQAYIDNFRKNPGNWYMFGRNCTFFVEKVLAAAHRGTSTRNWPRWLMHDLHQEYDNQSPYNVPTAPFGATWPQ
jgi:RHS repeat-associated protein